MLSIFKINLKVYDKEDISTQNIFNFLLFILKFEAISDYPEWMCCVNVRNVSKGKLVGDMRFVKENLKISRISNHPDSIR